MWEGHSSGNAVRINEPELGSLLQIFILGNRLKRHKETFFWKSGQARQPCRNSKLLTDPELIHIFKPIDLLDNLPGNSISF